MSDVTENVKATENAATEQKSCENVRTGAPDLTTLTGMDAATFATWMQKVESENAGQEKYAKKQYQMSMISAICSVLVLLIVIVCVGTLMPKINRTFEQVDAVMTDMESISDDLSQVDFGGMAEGVDSLVNESSTGVQEAIDKLNSIDIDTLNKSIQDLHNVVSPLASLFGK